MSNWTTALNHCLFDYRTTKHSATLYRPADIFLGFNTRGYMSYENNDVVSAGVNSQKLQATNKKRIDVNAKNLTFNKGSLVLYKTFQGRKFDIKGVLCKVIQQINKSTVLVENCTTKRQFKCNIEHLSKVSKSVDKKPNEEKYTRGEIEEETSSDELTHENVTNKEAKQNATNEASKLPSTPLLRRSRRVKRSPIRFGRST